MRGLEVHDGSGIMSSPSIADGIVYVGSDDGNIYAIGGDNLSYAPNPTAKPTATPGPTPTSSPTPIASPATNTCFWRPRQLQRRLQLLQQHLGLK